MSLWPAFPEENHVQEISVQTKSENKAVSIQFKSTFSHLKANSFLYFESRHDSQIPLQLLKLVTWSLCPPVVQPRQRCRIGNQG